MQFIYLFVCLFFLKILFGAQLNQRPLLVPNGVVKYAAFSRGNVVVSCPDKKIVAELWLPETNRAILVTLYFICSGFSMHWCGVYMDRAEHKGQV